MNKKLIYFILGWLLMLLGLLISVTVFVSNYLISIFIVIIGLITCVFHYFERKSIVVEKIVLISLLSAISSVGRIIFSSIPSVQPSSFIIMMAGLTFGKEIGLMTGVITAVASNLILGQGPWTPWQMFLWGSMGLLTAILRKQLMQNKFFIIIYGFLWGFLFGWIMNLWYIAGYMHDISIKVFIAACISSFYFDLAHGVSNVLLLIFAKDQMLLILNRINIKYKINKF